MLGAASVKKASTLASAMRSCNCRILLPKYAFFMFYLLLSMLFEWIGLACITRDRLSRHGQERPPRPELGDDQVQALVLSQLEHRGGDSRDSRLPHARQEIEIPDRESSQQDHDEDPCPCRNLDLRLSARARGDLLARRNWLNVVLRTCFLCHHTPPIALRLPELQEPAPQQPARRRSSRQGSGPSTRSWSKYTGCLDQAPRGYHGRWSGLR